MPGIEDIKIVLSFKGKDKVPADLVARIVLSVDKAVKELELSDFESMKKAVPSIPSDVLDAIDARLKTDAFQGIYLERAETGSLVLTSLVVSTTGWLLLELIGEAAKEAWDESSLHQEIKQFLLSRSKTKLGRLAPVILKTITGDISLTSEGVDIEIAKTDEKGDEVLYLRAGFSKKYPGPSRKSIPRGLGGLGG